MTHHPLCSFGSFSNTHEVDDELRGVLAETNLDLLKLIIGENRNGKVPTQLEPLAYKKQITAGTVYAVNFRLGENEYIHVRIRKDLAGHVGVQRVSDIKTENIEIHHF